MSAPIKLPFDVAVKNLSAENITLRSKDGSQTIEISAGDESVGLWIKSKNHDQIIAIYGTHDQGTAIGIYGPGDKKNGLSISLSAGDTGPEIQMVDEKGKTVVLTFKRLRELLRKRRGE